MIIAQNICAVIDAVHRAGFVFGDFNPANIGVDMNTGHVAFWDTDSYHIYDKATGTTYRCKVCLDGYVAPELLAKFKIQIIHMRQRLLRHLHRKQIISR